VLVITDGLDTGEPEVLERELGWLRRRSRRLLWLNPLLRFDGYAPLARGCGCACTGRPMACSRCTTSPKLEDLAASLAALMKLTPH
jgi:uncharacterized protein with von Willebrand factor type A (vWA) domain